MKSNYTLAIVTPIRYTAKEHFLDCISSVSQLSNRIPIPIQWLIVIDDDQRNIEAWVEEIVKNTGLHYKIIRSNKHIGLGEARNWAAEYTSAKYLTWLDADDLLNVEQATNFFVEGIKLLEISNDISLVYSDNDETDPELRHTHIRRKSFFHTLHLKHRGKQFDPLFYVDFIYQAQILRRSDFLNINGFKSDIIGEDVELLLRLAAEYPKRIFFHLPFNAYIYRRNPNGIVSTRYNELRKLNCKAYSYYAQKAQIHKSGKVSFEVLFLNENKGFLSTEESDFVFYNCFLPFKKEEQPHYLVSSKSLTKEALRLRHINLKREIVYE